MGHIARHGGPGARAGVQRLFDAADGLVEISRARGRKGSLVALRDATLLKVTYAFGLRRQEVARLDLVGLRTNVKAPQFDHGGQPGCVR